MDFYNLGQTVKSQIIEKYDHRNLNELFSFRTTAELMAYYFFGILLEEGLPVEGIRLWETRTGCVDISLYDFHRDEFNRLRRDGTWRLRG